MTCYSQAYQDDETLCSSCGDVLFDDDVYRCDDSTFYVGANELHLCSECYAEYEAEDAVDPHAADPGKLTTRE